MTNAGDALAPGTRLHELEIERVLGSGGFGITYLARDLSLDTWRAVKEYLPREWGTRRRDGTVGPWTGGNTEDYQWGLERFLDEARILARFKHPHIVQVHRVFEALGTAYMVMEYVEGRTLASQAKAAGALSEDRVREVLNALTKGLKEVHAAGLLHRDIKPGNVVVRQDGLPVLIDFGAARHAMGGHSGSLASVLTPGYAPIEQYPPGDRQGPWTDIYALGALAYCALSGVEPKAATERTREDRLRPVVEVAPQGVSRGLATAVGKAMAVYQEDRPQDLEAWQRLLDAPAGPVVKNPLGPGSSRGDARFTSSEVRYAGFWKRSAANLIDGAVLLMANLVVLFALVAGLGGDISDEAGGFLVLFVGITTSWLYYSFLEASPRQGTLGKMCLSIRVTGLDGQPIGFGKATGRHFGKFLSALPGVGFVMIGLTQEKQGLHDVMAGCLVVEEWRRLLAAETRRSPWWDVAAVMMVLLAMMVAVVLLVTWMAGV